MAAALHLFSSNFSSPRKISSSRKPIRSLNNRHETLLFNRRKSIALALSTTFLAFFNPNAASAFELRFTIPHQSVEEAEAMIKSHALDLLQIKSLVESESWRDAQAALRESSGYLKQDLYTIIQAKPGSQRASLRKLYSILFNNVSKLDYAARSKDAYVVKECYDNISATLGEILARI